MSNSEILDRGNRFAHMVERVVLNALAMKRAYRLIIRAFGELFLAIVFRDGESLMGAVTDAKQRPGFPPDPTFSAKVERDLRARW